MYEFIRNPDTGKQLNIGSTEGKQLLKNYIMAFMKNRKIMKGGYPSSLKKIEEEQIAAAERFRIAKEEVLAKARAAEAAEKEVLAKEKALTIAKATAAEAVELPKGNADAVTKERNEIKKCIIYIHIHF